MATAYMIGDPAAGHINLTLARRIGQTPRAAGGPTRAADEILTWRPER